jgi:hypothetical protein
MNKSGFIHTLPVAGLLVVLLSLLSSSKLRKLYYASQRRLPEFGWCRHHQLQLTSPRAHPGRPRPSSSISTTIVCAAVCAHTDPSIDGAKDKDTGRWRSGDVDERPQQRTCRSREPPLLSRVFSRRRRRPRSTGGPRSDGPTTPLASYIHTAPPPGRSLQTCSEAKQERERENIRLVPSSSSSSRSSHDQSVVAVAEKRNPVRSSATRWRSSPTPIIPKW